MQQPKQRSARTLGAGLRGRGCILPRSRSASRPPGSGTWRTAGALLLSIFLPFFPPFYFYLFFLFSPFLSPPTVALVESKSSHSALRPFPLQSLSVFLIICHVHIDMYMSILFQHLSFPSTFTLVYNFPILPPTRAAPEQQRRLQLHPRKEL